MNNSGMDLQTEPKGSQVTPHTYSQSLLKPSNPGTSTA